MGPSKQLKQIFQIEHNIVKNPSWPEAKQLAVYKSGRRFELGAMDKQIQAVARAGIAPETAGLRARHADHVLGHAVSAAVVRLNLENFGDLREISIFFCLFLVQSAEDIVIK